MNVSQEHWFTRVLRVLQEEDGKFEASPRKLVITCLKGQEMQLSCKERQSERERERQSERERERESPREAETEKEKQKRGGCTYRRNKTGWELISRIQGMGICQLNHLCLYISVKFSKVMASIKWPCMRFSLYSQLQRIGIVTCPAMWCLQQAIVK